MSSREAVKEAMEDCTRVSVFVQAIKAASAKHGVRPDILAGIISRETRCAPRWCQPPPLGRLGDYGNGHGPGQIDRGSYAEWCQDWRAGLLTTEDGIDKSAEVLAEKMGDIRKIWDVRTSKMKPEPKAPTADAVLRAAVASYNCGASRVVHCMIGGSDVDAFTTGKDYSRDVLQRAQVFAPMFTAGV